jgi:hypothetical protein
MTSITNGPCRGTVAGDWGRRMPEREQTLVYCPPVECGCGNCMNCEYGVPLAVLPCAGCGSTTPIRLAVDRRYCRACTPKVGR